MEGFSATFRTRMQFQPPAREPAQMTSAVYAVIGIAALFIFRLWAKLYQQKRPLRIAVLHPNWYFVVIWRRKSHLSSDQGGGGERLLWTALVSLSTQYPNAQLILYTTSKPSDSGNRADLVAKVQRDFGITVPDQLKIVGLRSFALADFRLYQSCVLFCHAVASILVAIEALFKGSSDLIVDSYGFPMVIPVFWITGHRCMTYIHYPWTNATAIKEAYAKISQSNTLKSALKRVYYTCMYETYRYCLRLCEDIQCNSTWTLEHVKSVADAKTRARIRLVYPPFDLPKYNLNFKDSNIIVSLAQFRPEKNHMTQLDVLKHALTSNRHVHLHMIGGCRNEQDLQRVEELRQHAKYLNMDNHLTLHVNIPIREVQEILKKATYGLHMMIEEHFGISVVEMMAAGIIVLAHNSGGPRDDIITDGKTGFLCSDSDEYCRRLAQVLKLPESKKSQIQLAAQDASFQRFNSKSFSSGFAQMINK